MMEKQEKGPFLSDKTKAVIDLVARDGDADAPRNTLKHEAFWSDKVLREVIRFRFVGSSVHFLPTINHLLMDFATGQCQLRALRIREIIWGALVRGRPMAQALKLDSSPLLLLEGQAFEGLSL
jgi:hypothetical protein